MQIVSISRSNYYGYGSVSTGGPVEPVSLAEAKAHCRVDFTDDDTYLTSLITQCRKRIENYCHISIVPQNVTCTIDFRAKTPPYYPPYGTNLGVPYGTSAYTFQGPRFELPLGPVLGFTSVTTVNFDNTVTILDPAQFAYNLRGTGFQQLEILFATNTNAIISYMAGYTGAIPDDVKLALLNEIDFRYEQRGSNTNRYASQNVGVSEGTEALLQNHIRYAWL